MEKDRKERR